MSIPLRLLILEDNPSDAELNILELRRAGYEVQVTRVETEAEFLSALDPSLDLILADYNLPQFDGLRALDLLIERGLDIPFIIVSGTIGEELAVETIKKGAADYLLKDRIARLGSAVTRALEDKRLREEKKTARKALREREMRFRALIENGSDQISVISVDGKLLYESPSNNPILGYQPNQFFNQSLFELVHPNDLEHLQNQLAQLVQDPQLRPREQFRMLHANGTWRWMEAIGTNLLAEPSVAGIVINYHDITERKNAEDERDRLFNLSVDLFCVAGFDGYFKQLNPAWEKTLGWTNAELMSKPFVEFVHPDDRVHTDEAVEILVGGLTVRLFDTRYLCKDGTYKWISWTAYPLLDDGLIFAVARDITEHRQAVAALAQSEHAFRTLFENMPIGQYRTSAEGQILDANPALVTMLGYKDRESLLAKNIVDIYADPLTDEIFKSQIGDGNYLANFEAECLRPDGTKIWTEDHVHVVRNELNEIIAYEGSLLDITERRQAQEKIRSHLNRLEVLRNIDHAIAASMDLDQIFQVIFEQSMPQIGADAIDLLVFNPISQTLNFAAGRGFRTKALQHTQLRLGEGYAGRAALGRKLNHISNLQGRNTDFLRSPLFSQEEFISYYCTPLIANDDIKGVLEVYHRVPFEADDEWLRFLDTLAGQAAIAIENVSLFKNLQLSNINLENRVEERTIELTHANRTKDEFLANMSHELRTPLNSILGFSESLLEKRRGPLNEKQEQYIQLIHSSGQHLLGLINDILEVSKIEAGKLELHLSNVSIKEVCESSLNFVKEMAVKKSITIELNINNLDHKLHADSQRLKQILVNLLSNAVKFTPQGGKVSLEVQTNPEKDRIRFSVTDTGIGISHENLSKLFTPFTQLESSLSREYEGTGLGLVLVLKFTELHGGSVKVESESGEGSRFSIILPWSEAEIDDQIEDSKPTVSEKDNKDTVPIHGSRGKILLADDSESNVLTVQDYLLDHGFGVIVAHNGFEAVSMTRELSPDMVLMDIQMPKMDGLEAIRRIRSTPEIASVPIIALTALAMPGDRERCLEAGAKEYMSKPVSLKALIITMQKLINK